MSKIFNADSLEFVDRSSRIKEYVCKTSKDLSESVNSEQMHFDVRILEPGKYFCPYHFHKTAEEMMVILSGGLTSRTPEGFDELKEGDIVFFEKGSSGAHQFYNHTDKPCTYLDIKIKVEVDVCEYPDSGKVNISSGVGIFFKDQTVDYFDGEDNVSQKWEKAKKSFE